MNQFKIEKNKKSNHKIIKLNKNTKGNHKSNKTKLVNDETTHPDNLNFIYEENNQKIFWCHNICYLIFVLSFHNIFSNQENSKLKTISSINKMEFDQSIGSEPRIFSLRKRKITQENKNIKYINKKTKKYSDNNYVDDITGESNNLENFETLINHYQQKTDNNCTLCHDNQTNKINTRSKKNKYKEAFANSLTIKVSY